MKKSLATLIVCSFVAIAVLGAFTLHNGSGSHVRCIAETAAGTDCPVNNVFATANFLLNVFKRRINKVQLIRQEELFRYNQLATLGELSAGLTHEIVTPLSNIKFNLSVIKCQEKSSIKEELSAALNGVEHIDSLIQSYLSHLKGEDRYMYFAPHDEISKAQNLLEFRIRKNRIKLLTEVDKKALILGNPIKFNQVIINLLKNAIDTYKSSDQSDLEESEDDFKVIEIKEQSSNTHFKLKIVDFGAGIEPQNKHKIFDKFFTTKPLGEGTGLGLPNFTKNPNNFPDINPMAGKNEK